jgi:CBS domain containing-hemolysin-like protein
MSVLAWIIIVGLILVTALYVAAEFAVVTVRPSRVQARAEEGSTLARTLLPILTDPHQLDRYIAASQIGITISSLVLGAYGQAALSGAVAPLLERYAGMDPESAHSTAAVVILIVLTLLAMILGELIPKSLALHAPTKVALWTVLPMQWSVRALSWFIVVLNGSGALILRAFGASMEGHRHVHSPEEIEYLVAESGKGGLLKPSESLRLRQALHLGRRPIRELMVPRTRIEAVRMDDELAEAFRAVADSSYTRLPVYRDDIDDIVGVVHARDVALAAWSDAPPPTIEQVMRPPLVLPASMMADRVLGRMKEEGHTMVILADEYGGTAGLVTIDNILDDLIGDVTDEFRADAPAPEMLPDGRVRLPGSYHASDAARWTRVRWHGAFTVGGVVLAAFGRAPRAKERIDIAGVEVEVERVNRSRIDSVLVRPRAISPTDAESAS